MGTSQTDLQEFLSYFPEVAPPFTITEESIDHFMQTNEDLPFALVAPFIEEWEGKDEEDMTEYYPCLKLPKEEDYHCFIYWRASFMRYEFIIVTLDNKGDLITRKVIAGSRVDKELMLKSAARIDEDRIIHIMTGVLTNSEDLEPENSKPYTMEILPTGEILSYSENEIK